MSFKEFLGNEPAVRHLREALAAGRLPHAMVLAGPRGAGKYTLALMLAQAANCLDPQTNDGLPDYCGVCRNCTRIAAAADLDARVAEAVAAREELRETDKKETRILVQTHPDVLVIPPDPPQLLIKLGQVRTVIRGAYRMPAEARRAFSIFTSGAFMKEAANSLLKVLEEPPDSATLILLTTNLQELLPTIRSRTSVVRLGAVPVEEIEALLAARRPEWKQRPLIARLAQGAVGQALGFDLDAYLASRVDALIILRSALREPDHSTLFKMTETYRAGADGQEKTAALIRAMLNLLEDLLLVKAEQPALVRNIDLAAELQTDRPRKLVLPGSKPPHEPWRRSSPACGATSCVRSRSTRSRPASRGPDFPAGPSAPSRLRLSATIRSLSRFTACGKMLRARYKLLYSEARGV